MIVVRVAVYCSILVNLSTASEECTSENCKPKHKIGIINVARENKLLRELIEHKGELERIYKFSDLRKYMVFIQHRKIEIPEFFDAREKWPMCESISRIKDQGTCGTCWAFSGGMVASDRLCIASEGRTKLDVSQQHLVTCCPVCFDHSSEDRCSAGSDTLSAYAYMIENDVVDEQCKPYDYLTAEDKCKLSCKNETMPYNGVNLNMSVILGGFIGMTSTIEDIQIEIMQHGPVDAHLYNLTDVFAQTYQDEVYINYDPYNSDEESITHAVRIIGWGIEDGVPYWLCANSWGEDWGKLKGFFKLRRGTNEFGMEYMFLAIGPKSRLIEEDDDKSPVRVPGHSSAISFRKTSHIFKITIVVIVLNF